LAGVPPLSRRGAAKSFGRPSRDDIGGTPIGPNLLACDNTIVVAAGRCAAERAALSIDRTLFLAGRCPMRNKTHSAPLTDDEVIEPMPLPQANRDPISGARGSHPVGVGVGAMTAGVVGGVVGSAVPLLGTAIGVAVGTAVGAVIGGFAGKGAAETLFPTEEESFWRSSYIDRPYYDHSSDFTFDQDYLAAYRFGYVNAYAYGTMDFEDVEPQLREAWESSRDASRLAWDQARAAANDAWHRARANQAAADRVTEASEGVQPMA
jgi:hypothetical protein